MNASVVICAYTERRLDDVKGAVASVLPQLGDGDELLLVVDHNPALHALLADHLPPRVHLVESDQTRGLAGARNTGVASSTGEVVIFLDDDAAAQPGWLAELLAPFADRDVLGVGGWIEPQWATDVRPSWFPDEFDWVVGCCYRGLPVEGGTVRNLIGASMAIRREVFEVVGGFTEGMGRIGTKPLGCEETELCIRATHAFPEGRFVLAPAARVTHKVGPERARWSYFVSRCFSEGISKAAVARRSTRASALSAERAHAARTLPAGVARNIGVAVRDRDPQGAVRAGAIVLGLVAASAGYLRGQATPRWSSTRRRKGWEADVG